MLCKHFCVELKDCILMRKINHIYKQVLAIPENHADPYHADPLNQNQNQNGHA